MKSEDGIYKANYIELVFNGTETITFSNWEVLKDVEYVPDEAPEILTAESGKSFSVSKKQQEYFRFNLKYLNAETRIKWEKIRAYASGNYTLSATLRSLTIPHSNFPPVATVYTETFQDVVATFSQAVIELPKDFAFDRSGRGLGSVQIEDIPIRILRSTTLPVPLSACDSLTMAAFTLSPFSFTGGGMLDFFIVERNVSGLIASIDGYPAGELYLTGDGSLLDTVSYNAGSGLYGPDTDPNIPDTQNMHVIIPNVPVTLITGDTCSITFTQYYVTAANNMPIASGVSLSGVFEVGQTITLSYTYSDPDGDAEGATITGIYSYPTLGDAAAHTNYTLLSSSTTYVLTASELGTYIRGRVVPVAVAGTSPGSQVFTTTSGPVITANTPPTASSVVVSGTMESGQTLSMSFTYSDLEGDAAGAHVYQWYTYTDAGGTLGETLFATGISAVPSGVHVGLYIRGKVTPVAATGASPGAQVTSSVYGPVVAANTAPVASSVAISGYQGVGNTLTVSYSYTDADGDTEDLAETDVIWYSYTAADLITGKTAIQTGKASGGLTYLQTSGLVGKWVNCEITPAASSGVSPGITVASAGVGPIYTKIGTLRTDKETSVNIQVAFASTKVYQLRMWDDYTSTSETPGNVVTNTGAGNQDSNIFTYGTAGLVHRIEIWGEAVTQLLCVSAASMEITYLDLSAATAMGGAATNLTLTFSGNAGLSTVLLPTTTGGRLGVNFNSTAIPSANLSGWLGLSGNLQFTSCTSLSNLVLPTSTTYSGAALSSVTIRSCSSLSNTLDFSGCNFANNYDFELGNMALVPTFVMPDIKTINTTIYYIWSMSNASFTKAYLDKIKFQGTVRVVSCVNIDDLGSTAAATFTPTMGTSNLNLFQLGTLPAVTQAVNLAAFSNSQTAFQVFDCTSMGTLTVATTNDKTFTSWQINGSNQSSVDLGGYTQLMNVNNSRVEIKSMSLSAAVVNQILVDLDAITTSGSHTGRVIDLTGNSAPDTTSGGVNGAAAKTSLIAKGITVTTA